MQMWDERRHRKDRERAVTNWEVYANHMNWYDDGAKYRLRLRPKWTAEDIASLEEEENSKDEAYRKSLREMEGDFREYAPLMNRVASELNRNVIDGSNALSYDPGTVEANSQLRETMKKIMNRCRKLAGMLGCATSTDVCVPVGSTRPIASSSHAGAGSSRHAASSSRIVQEEEEEEGGDEEEYDDDDGPPPNSGNPGEEGISSTSRCSEPITIPASSSSHEEEDGRRTVKEKRGACLQEGEGEELVMLSC